MNLRGVKFLLSPSVCLSASLTRHKLQRIRRLRNPRPGQKRSVDAGKDTNICGAHCRRMHARCDWRAEQRVQRSQLVFLSVQRRVVYVRKVRPYGRSGETLAWDITVG